MKIVIIGNGISGITLARNLRKATKDPITVISSETEYFFSRTALMYIYMGHMKYEHTKPYEDHFWKKNTIDLIQKHVSNIQTAKKTLEFTDRSQLDYDILVLATGSKSNSFGWPGQKLKGVQTLYSFQDLNSLEENFKEVWLFENEPVNINLIEKHFPATRFVFIDTNHCGRETISPGG